MRNAELLSVSCEQCSAIAPRQAKFCPRCGAEMPDRPNPLGYFTKANRELLIGWILWIAGGAMVLFGIFAMSGGKSWMAIGLGIPLFVIGMGSLVGDETPKGSGNESDTAKSGNPGEREGSKARSDREGISKQLKSQVCRVHYL